MNSFLQNLHLVHMDPTGGARSDLDRGHGHGAAAGRLPTTMAMAPPRAIIVSRSPLSP